MLIAIVIAFLKTTGSQTDQSSLPYANCNRLAAVLSI